MSEIRKRVGADGKGDSESENKHEDSFHNQSASESDDTDSEDIPGISQQPSPKGEKSVAEELKNATSGTDTTPEVLDAVTKNMSARWRNLTVRFTFGVGMIFGFLWILSMGPIAIVLLVMGIQLMCFSEIINIGYIVYKSQNLPWFRTLSWYFLFTSNYYIYGETMIDQFGMLLDRTNFLRPLVTYHRFISFSLYMAGVMFFITILKKRYYVKQFSLFGYTHVTLLIIAVGANLIIRNVFEGIFWFFLACSAIICNDIWAYFVGFFFGRTPLIKLSPKKTWEGYLGGGLATLLYAAIVSNVMVRYDYLVCPLEYNLRKDEMSVEGCVRNPAFVLNNYTLPKILQTLSSRQTVEMYPITFHALFLAAFASLIGPFGGFFASGFKRAFKIKDFGDIFPGHGGFMDRFDCQVLMGIFTNIYISSFVKIPNPSKLLTYIYAMHTDDQLTLLHSLCDGLQTRGIVNCSITGNGV